MPVLSQPQLVGITGAKNARHSVSFAYNWVGDAIKAVNINGVAFQGSSCILDVRQLPTNVAELPPFRTLLISQEFDDATNDAFDGELIVSVAGTNQVLRFAGGATLASSAGAFTILTACVPIVANAPTKLVFGKARNFGGAMFGKLFVSIFDFDMEPYTTLGYACDTN